VLRQRPDELAARELLVDAVDAIGAPNPDPAWPWPEPRLTYSNAAIAEVLILAGSLLPDSLASQNGLALLAFLLRTETRG